MPRGSWSFRRAFIKEREAVKALRLLAIPLLILWAGEEWRDGWREFPEWEGLVLLCGAAILNLTGRLLYERVVRPLEPHGLSRRWTLAGLAAVSAFLLLVALTAPLAGRSQISLARRLGVKPVGSARDLPELACASAGDLSLVDDDTLQESQPALAGGAG